MKIQLFSILLSFLISLSSLATAQVTGAELERAIEQNITKVNEFNFIKEQADRMRLRVYLFGGTAASFLHYVKWDLERKNGTIRFLETRFDYDFTNIYRSTQDLDIVIDGNLRNIQDFQNILERKFPHFIGSKAQWEVRSLRESQGTPGQYYKEALLNDFDFNNQHSDSNSTGLIEITRPNDNRRIKDLRNWNAPNPTFLSDAAQSQITYYWSMKHFETARAKAGQNPEIFSVIRYLTKAFQYDLKIPEKDHKTILKIIESFKSSEVSNSNTLKRFLDISKKLFIHAVNLEYAWNYLEKTGLRNKLLTFNHTSETDSLSWWMNKEPLRSQSVGQGSGKTAQHLNISLVSHEANTLLALESITRSNLGEPNILISRNGQPGESAAFGDGFYTQIGREGARGTGLTARFLVNPLAREGSDFTVSGSYVVFKNKNALKFLDEQPFMTATDYFSTLVQGKSFIKSDMGIIEKFKRRLSHGVTSTDLDQVNTLLSKSLDSPKKGVNYELVVKEYLKIAGSQADKHLTNKMVSAWKVQLTGADYYHIIFLPEFQAASKDQRFEMYWNFLIRLDNPSKFLLPSDTNLKYQLPSGYQSGDFGNFLNSTSTKQLAYFLMKKIDVEIKSEKLMNLYHSLGDVGTFISRDLKTESEFDLFFEFCNRNKIHITADAYFNLKVAPLFSLKSESQKVLLVLEYFNYYLKESFKSANYNDHTSKTIEILNQIIDYTQGAVFFANMPQNSISLLKDWADSQDRFDLTWQLINLVRPKLRSSMDFYLEYLPKLHDGLFPILIIDYLQSNPNPMTEANKSFARNTFEDMSKIKNSSIPNIELLGKKLSITKSMLIEGLLINLAALKDSTTFKQNAFLDTMNNYFHFLNFGAINLNFNLRSFYFEGYQDMSQSQDKTILDDVKKKAALLLEHPKETAELYNFFFMQTPNAKSSFKNSKEFLDGLNKIQKLNLPLGQSGKKEFIHLEERKILGSLQSLQYCFYTLVSLNYAAKYLLPDVFISNYTFSDSSSLIENIFLFNIAMYPVIKYEFKSLLEYSKLKVKYFFKNKLFNFAKKSFIRKAENIDKFGNTAAQLGLALPPKRTCKELLH